jgi:hypothetical protein
MAFAHFTIVIEICLYETRMESKWNRWNLSSYIESEAFH